MKNSREEKGITLVALIITIVVLLILAGVAIGTVRDSDIIGYAKNASNSYEQARNNEISEIQSAEDLLEQYASQKNSWQQKGLTVPVEYGKKYTGSVAPGLGLSSLTITLGANGELSVEEAGINSTCNDSKITSITSNTITYNDDGDEIRIEYSADGKSAEVFYNNNKLGDIEVVENIIEQREIEYYINADDPSIIEIDYTDNKVGLHAAGANGQYLSTSYFDVAISEMESVTTCNTGEGTNVEIRIGSTHVTIMTNGATFFYVQDEEIFSPADGGNIADGFKLVKGETEIAEVKGKIESWTNS